MAKQFTQATFNTYKSAAKKGINFLKVNGPKLQTAFETMFQNDYKSSRKLPEIMVRYNVIILKDYYYHFLLDWEEAKNIIMEKVLPEYFNCIGTQRD
jgi:hypothetical protein